MGRGRVEALLTAGPTPLGKLKIQEDTHARVDYYIHLIGSVVRNKNSI